MKSKLLVAAVACLALGACNHDASSNKHKDEKKPAAEQNQGAQPAAQQPGHTSMEDANQTTNLAADDQSRMVTTATTPTEQRTSVSEQDINKAQQDVDTKVQEMHQDTSNAATQVQGATQAQPSSTEPAELPKTGETTDHNATQAPAH